MSKVFFFLGHQSAPPTKDERQDEPKQTGDKRHHEGDQAQPPAEVSSNLERCQGEHEEDSLFLTPKSACEDPLSTTPQTPPSSPSTVSMVSRLSPLLELTK